MGRLGRELLRLWHEPRDPRLAQLGFTLLFLLDMTLRVVGGVDLGLAPRIAFAAAPAVWVACLLIPWRRTPEWARPIWPILDLGLVGLGRLDESGGSILLAVVPAIWLGFVFGMRGALVAAAATVGLITVPGLAYAGTTGLNLSRSVIVALMVTSVSLLLANVTARVRGGQETIEHQRRISEAMLDTVDVGLVLLDRDGLYSTMNRRHHDFMRLAFPHGHEGAAGQLGEVFQEDGETRLEREEMPTYRAAHGEEFEDQLIWVGNDPLTRRALSVSSRVVTDEQGGFAGAALAYKDVTDFVRALEVKDEFVASVSHELRTPLTSISGFTELVLERDDIDEEVVQYLGVVQRNVNRLDRLVSDLLQTAQVDRGQIHLDRKPTDIARLVRQSVEAARPAVDQAGLTVSCQAPDELVLTVDQQRFSQVVDNLVSNAVKYTPAGGSVDVDLSVAHDRVELVVRDTGIGISMRDRSHVFSRFFRTRVASKSSIQGIGLGLSITKAIVESHGGRIEVDSQVGVGSTFRVRLPLAVAAPVGPAPSRRLTVGRAR